MKKGFIKGEALRLLRTNFSETAFNESITNFKSPLIARGYPYKMIKKTLSKVSFAGRQSALQQKAKAQKQILPFVTTYHPSVCNLKSILMLNWDLIQNQPLLNTIFKNPPILSYRRVNLLQTRSLKLSYEGFIHLQLNHLNHAGSPCMSLIFIHCSAILNFA